MATKKRLVYASEVEEIFNYVEHKCSDSYKAFKVAIEKATTVDAVVVVRCGKCKWWDPNSEYCQFWHGLRHPGHYCGEGERK